MRREEGQGQVPFRRAGSAWSGVRAAWAAFTHVLRHKPLCLDSFCMLGRPKNTENHPLSWWGGPGDLPEPPVCAIPETEASALSLGSRLGSLT